MRISHTIDEFPFCGELLTLELSVRFTVSKYVAASMHGGADHLGWPAEGGEVENLDVTILHAMTEDGTDLAEDDDLKKSFDDSFPEHRQRVEEACREEATPEPDYDDRDD